MKEKISECETFHTPTLKVEMRKMYDGAYTEGFRAGVEAAAVRIENDDPQLADHIRALLEKNP